MLKENRSGKKQRREEKQEFAVIEDSRPMQGVRLAVRLALPLRECRRGTLEGDDDQDHTSGNRRDGVGDENPVESFRQNSESERYLEGKSFSLCRKRRNSRLSSVVANENRNA